MNGLEIKRGDIVLARYFFNDRERTGPVLVIQNNWGNRVSPLVIVAPIVPCKPGDCLDDPLQVPLGAENAAETGLKNSSVLLNVILTIERKRLLEIIGRLPGRLVPKIEAGLKFSLGLEQGGN
ncbi:MULTISPECIES: type II toxin-antitoxin system PemK/MazF family toxin [Carboxydocella]|uniref:mRNA interferase MazF n=2 Tax=Carboxydocella TaxID=178898 RepID=A0A1T4NHU6_9FIRM|nr:MULTISPECIES: type II toxin-antitoxin system PemK/MazF family toxin [Carboxydocella]AVX20047.1 mRNA interferase MazF [Carboxydocella thermautotrophica]AVX30464.1 mRNA interferase MazF [Carboxydocella thermautotrophica]SJZ78683.1 mRNA interferase MazF [Carboxydocella sporoproducens DSM 16521]GAW27877.1 mRNA interferase MazF [Carboxydocella sp. ULO1]GAW31632.1 mRNA interferase MazF [Carboxydocella sp. JDF658]